MFILHSSNKTENLVEHLALVLRHDPLSSPFSKEVLIIQSQGLERWLSQQLASRFRVWANYQFLFPWKFFVSISHQLDSRIDDNAFSRNQLHWRLEALLRELNDVSFIPLRNYLASGNQALKRFQLADQLALIFDQYQIMRPELLAAWQADRLVYHTETERWQKRLWQQLTSQIGKLHRGEQWLEIIKKLNAAPVGAFADKLPERVSIFGINTMPPLFLEYLQSVAKHCQVHVFLFNPVQTYWVDLASKRQSSSENLRAGHPLLISLGQQGREFQALLLDLAQFDVEPESFTPKEDPNNLQQLQNGILNNEVVKFPLVKDHSIRLHACHSRKREVEVLKDQLLMALERDATLELRDIVVMAPDIQDYEPYISAVFHDIQHSIADRGLRQDNQILDVFIRFLELSQSRLGWQSVLDFLERDEVHSTFGLSNTDLELISFWVQENNVRWGQSGSHKQELGLPPLEENTWQALLDRLLMGYALGDDDQFVLGVLPYKNIEGTSTAALGGLNDFLQLLFKARVEFKQAKPLKHWGGQLSYYAEQLFGNADALARQPLNELILELSTTLAGIHHEPVELTIIQHWLNSTVSERISVNGFLRGQLTFCSMIPMRAIPFKVIALMGINEGEFPKIDRNPTFDLISQHLQKGDRSRRADDRYQFLEILLSARQQLIITYVGQSQATNDIIPPSVVVNELLDVLKEHYELSELITYHPLQAFSSRYFDSKSNDLFSFSQNECAYAQALTGPKLEPDVWWRGSIQVNQEEIIEINDLFNFFQHPQRYFLRKQMGLKLSDIRAGIDEREPFALAELPTYTLLEEGVEQLLNNQPISLEKLRAQGRWLAGTPGDLEFARYQTVMTDFVNRIKTINIGLALEDLSIDSKFGSYRLIGKLGNRYQNGNLIYRYATLKGKGFINAWLAHLILNLTEPQTTYLLSADESLVFSPNDCQPDDLLQWLEIYQNGKHRPDAFFTEAALAYVQQATNPKAKKPPLDTAIDSLVQALAYDLDLSQLYSNQPDRTLLINESFAQHCETLLVPIWQSVHAN